MGSPLMSPHELMMKRYEVARSCTGSGVGVAIGREPNASAVAVMNASVTKRVGPKAGIGADIGAETGGPPRRAAVGTNRSKF